MNRTIYEYIHVCDDDVLYLIFEKVVEEMNKRKTAEGVKNDY